MQKALDGVSFNFRDNEFVAVLGASGSGKTTLLNIIGGLDRYDSGELIINSVSTKKYSDRDWDSYRNHTIGFVFQSYNLIPHQTILSNVELALTISGIDREERKKRAKDALDRVGLSEHIHKKPSQLSGGQMQRVAIARALVNDPEILLADEPTGALDSETGRQVMDLLKEVAYDRLVVMVTHNPELASEYATRTIKLSDGRIISDSDPYEVPENIANEAAHRSLGRASMSPVTALSLSFNNMKTKLARTLLVAFAGSIGIIGIALIMSLSNGVNNYIDSIEEDTLKEYPLTIDSNSFDLTSLIQTGRSSVREEKGKKRAEVTEAKAISNMFSMLGTNDLGSLKKYIENGKNDIIKHSRAIEYSYDIEPKIFRRHDNEYKQVNPDKTFTSIGFSYSGNSAYSKYMKSNVFFELPEHEDLYKKQYDIKAGRWPRKYNECIVALTPTGRVTDLALYAMGLNDPDKLDDMINKFESGKTIKDNGRENTFRYKDMLGIKFKLVQNSDCYTYDNTKNIWVDKSDNEEFMSSLAQRGEDLKIVGVVKPKKNVKFTMLMGDIYYDRGLSAHIINHSASSDIVRDQMKNPDKNVITGRKFGDKEADSLGDIFSVDENAFAKVFSFDADSLKNAMRLSPSNIDKQIDANSLAKSIPGVSEKDMQGVISSSMTSVSANSMQVIFRQLMAGYFKYAAANPSTDYMNITAAMREYLRSSEVRTIISRYVKAGIEAKVHSADVRSELNTLAGNIAGGLTDYISGLTNPDIGRLNDYKDDYIASQDYRDKLTAAESGIISKLSDFDINYDAMSDEIADGYVAYARANNKPDPSRFADSFGRYLKTAEADKIISSVASGMVNQNKLAKEMSRMINSYSKKMLTTAFAKIVSAISSAMQRQMESMGSKIQDSFKVDPNALAGAINMNMDPNEIKDMISSLISGGKESYYGNLSAMGYADNARPSAINIYAGSFEDKAKIKDVLDKYNKDMENSGKDEKVISYTDIVGALMSSVTDIIDAISYVLIAFVSISLVVSSIMIGVITYISVLERRKEIGILRAIGASKRNTAQVFNAETFIIGGLAGLMGVIISMLLLIPGNAVIHAVTNNNNITAVLPVSGGIILVVLSVALTLIGGQIPSRKAAKSDPVTALRTD